MAVSTSVPLTPPTSCLLSRPVKMSWMEGVVMSAFFFPAVNSSPVGNEVSVPFAPGLMLSKPMTHLASRTMLLGEFCGMEDSRLNDGAAVTARSRPAPRTSRTPGQSCRRSGSPRVLDIPEGICALLVVIAGSFSGSGWVAPRRLSQGSGRRPAVLKFEIYGPPQHSYER